MAKTKAKAAKEGPFVGCTLRALPDELAQLGIETALAANSANGPPLGLAAAMSTLALVGEEAPSPQRLALLVNRRWPAGGFRHTVAFVDRVTKSFRERVLRHANEWNRDRPGVRGANMEYVWTEGVNDANVRVGTDPGEGHYSYMGTDNQHIRGKTMNLALSDDSPEAEFERVVPHEFGHEAGFPHEHTRPEIIALLDPAGTLEEFRVYQGWDRQTVYQQILTAMQEGTFVGTAQADPESVLCYWFSGRCTKSGKPILGGKRVNDRDLAFAAKCYPKPDQPPPPSDGQPYRVRLEDGKLLVEDSAGRVTGRFAATAEKFTAAWKLTREA